MLSSRGQLLSAAARFGAASRRFAAALTAFREAGLPSAEAAREQDRTGVYAAINALDGKLRQGEDRLRAVITQPGESLTPRRDGWRAAPTLRSIITCWFGRSGCGRR